ncbi:hypothetical protein G7Y89_g10544 [Cudoniella acicularis]|uniref:Uncharacterized protein n=1 Tax=Cudoniella acicularis TaxID=354080 RepID=A0A8H4VYX6_9HELO|nr:hypothetical protein G7Y89_g10544 [Cudoniella acicularis]
MADAAERPKTFMDRWVEPVLPPPRPSFAEAGFQRGGTVMNMAPLGTLPSAKVLKNAAKAEMRDGGAGRVRRSEASNATTPETPEPPPVFTRRPSLPTKDEEAPMSPKTPQAQTSPPKSAQKPTPNTNPHKIGQSVFSLSDAPLPVPTNVIIPAPPMESPSPYASIYRRPTPELDDDGDPVIDLETTDRVVEDAVQAALDRGRYPTAYALRMLYDEKRSDVKTVRLFEALYQSRGTVEQLEEFTAMMRVKKKEGKKDRTGEYYFNGDGSDPPQKLRFSAVSAALTYDTPLGRPGSGGGLLTDQGRRSSLNPSLSGSPIDASHILKKQKLAHKDYISPFALPNTLVPTTNGSSAKPATPQQNGIPSSLAPRVRSGSESSSSSLSSVDEQIINNAVLSPEKRNASSTATATAASGHVAAGLDGDGGGCADSARVRPQYEFCAQ